MLLVVIAGHWQGGLENNIDSVAHWVNVAQELRRRYGCEFPGSKVSLQQLRLSCRYEIYYKMLSNEGLSYEKEKNTIIATEDAWEQYARVRVYKLTHSFMFALSRLDSITFDRLFCISNVICSFLSLNDRVMTIAMFQMKEFIHYGQMSILLSVPTESSAGHSLAI